MNISNTIHCDDHQTRFKCFLQLNFLARTNPDNVDLMLFTVAHVVMTITTIELLGTVNDKCSSEMQIFQCKSKQRYCFAWGPVGKVN